MPLFFLKWSRTLHKWIGIYVALLTLVWIGELLLFPALYSVDPVEVVPTQLAAGAQTQVGPLSIEGLSRRVESGQYGRFGADVEIRYLAREKKYVVVDRNSYAVSEVSAQTGELLSRGLDSNALFAEKAGLSWVSETVGSIIKAPFEISFVILSITGVYLVVFPYLRRKPASGQGILDLTPGDEFLFRTTSHSRDMARIAAQGLLPGVKATVMRIPRRGPVILSARNTRIAVARNVAASFQFEKMES